MWLHATYHAKQTARLKLAYSMRDMQSSHGMFAQVAEDAHMYNHI